MTFASAQRDIEYRSQTLPRGTFARSIFDNHLVKLSDRGGASQAIGSAWSDVAADVLNSWIGASSPALPSRLGETSIEEVFRLDTLPGVEAAASRAGLKNPDFVVFGSDPRGSIVFALDAKFSVETARPVQVSAETTSMLFAATGNLASLLPDTPPNSRFLDGAFLSPDYSLTHAMFREKIGHRRLTVSRQDVALAATNPREMLATTADAEVMERFASVDRLPFDVWSSLLAAQYYFRLERAAVGLQQDERRPLLGEAEPSGDSGDLRRCVASRANGAESAWAVVSEWDRDVERIRRQRQAIHQVIGIPISNADLRDLADRLMASFEADLRPSRNQVRKALGGRFLADVVRETGAVVPPVADFPAELSRVASAAKAVGERYTADMPEIVGGIISELTTRDGRRP